MNTLIVFTIGFASALIYSRGKADPVQSLKVDAKRFWRWGWKKWKQSEPGFRFSKGDHS